MKLNEYQSRAMETCMPSCENFSYMMLNLVGEIGEFAGKVAKMIRRGEAVIDTMDEHRHSDLYVNNNCEWDVMKDELKKEAGDILWQLSGLCRVMGWDLEGVAQGNLDKLASRKERGVIDGSGDNR